MMRELDTAVLTGDMPEHGLMAGDVGAVVHVYDDGQSFEVEFVAGDGKTVALITLDAGDIRAVAGEEILHVRGISSA